MANIGIALGGGGAKGIAHIVVLEAMEELGLKPMSLAGTSIGAVIAALYAGGASCEEIRGVFLRFSIDKRAPIHHLVTKGEIFKWLDFIGPQFRGKGLIRVENLLDFVFQQIESSTFEELHIPLRVVAADFWTREEHVIESGLLLPAVRGSMSLPGLLEPVKRNGNLLIDGGAVNPIPFDRLHANCDITIAVDALGTRSSSNKAPSLSDAIFNTFQIMQKSIIREKLIIHRPDLYIDPQLTDIRTLEFYRAKEILDSADKQKDKIKRQIHNCIKTHSLRR